MSVMDVVKGMFGANGGATVPTLPSFPYSDWPPPDEQPRLDGYKKFQALYDANPVATFDNRLISDKELYVIANLSRLIVTIPADIMLGEPFSVDTDDVDDEAI